MPFIKRDENNVIVGLFNNAQDGVAVEVLQDSDAEVIAFKSSFAALTAPEVTVTPLQARRALSAAGLRANVDAHISSLPQDAQDAWEYATSINRSDALISSVASALELTEQQIDDLFALAKSF